MPSVEYKLTPQRTSGYETISSIGMSSSGRHTRSGGRPPRCVKNDNPDDDTHTHIMVPVVCIPNTETPASNTKIHIKPLQTTSTPPVMRLVSWPFSTLPPGALPLPSSPASDPPGGPRRLSARNVPVLGASTTQLFRNVAAALSFEPGDELVLSAIDRESPSPAPPGPALLKTPLGFVLHSIRPKSCLQMKQTSRRG